jgi:RNA polymerase sigma-70 factor (ECF subfamily)
MGEPLSSFEELFLPHLNGAYNLARWLVGDDRYAQAIVEEAYRQAHREVRKFRNADARRSLLTIVRKRAHAWILSHNQWSIVRPSFHPSGATVQGRTVADQSDQRSIEAVNQEWKTHLHEALRKLPVELREVLVFHEIEGWTYRQLASVLKVPPAAVAQRLGLARQTLSQELAAVHRRRPSDD